MKIKTPLFLIILSIPLFSCGPKVEDPTTFYKQYDYNSYTPNTDESGNIIIDMYGINDFHGALNFNEKEKHPGIGRLSSYLFSKRDENKGGTIFVSTGDNWQGSIESNINRGKVVNEIFNYLPIEVTSIGNHEFDWGIEQMLSNSQYLNAPMLGSNIVYKGTSDRLEGIDASTIIERGGVKIGFIGTIGSSLETSIKASLIETVEFAPIDTYVKNESLKLKDEGAEIIVLLDHDTWITQTADKLIATDYVDMVFSGHQHVKDESIINSTHVLQTEAYGQQVMHAQFVVNKSDKSVKVEAASVSDYLVELQLAEDPTSVRILNYYNNISKINDIRKEVLTTLIERDMNISQIAKLATVSMVEYFDNNPLYVDKEVIGAVHHINGGIRVDSFVTGKLTYGNLYQAFPFDNEVVIFPVYGESLFQSDMDALKIGNASYFTIQRKDIDRTKTYYIATIDYLYELKYNKKYKAENTFELSREIIADYLRSKTSILASDYNG